MIKELVNNDKGVTRLMVGTMLVACMVAAGLLAFASYSDSDKALVYSGGPDDIGTLLLKGAVIAQGDEVILTVAIPEGGERVNFTAPPHNVVVISYADDNRQVENLPWKVTNWGPGADGDNLLEFGENFRIAVETPGLEAGATFDIKIMTPDGQVLDIERTMPDEITPVVNLH